MLKRKICSLCCKKGSFQTKYILTEFNIIECKNCHLLARDTQFNKQESIKLYSKDYYCNLQKDYFSAGISQNITSSLRYIEFKERLQKINKYCKIKKGKILDVGCGTGVFLKIAKDQGWKTNGVELSPFAATFAKTKFKLNIFSGDLQETKFKKNYFDVITSWDVIEHTEKPRELVIKAREILKPKGYIVLQTTMVDSLLFLIADVIYKLTFTKSLKLAEMGYQIRHTNHFSRQTLKKLLVDNNFKIIASENVEISYEETSLPKFCLPFLKIIGFFSKLTGYTIEFFIIGQKQL